MNVDEERKNSTPTAKDVPMDPIIDTSKLKIARDEELQEDEKKRKEESRAQYMLKRDKPTAKPRAKSAGPPGWRPPAKEDSEHGCLGPLEPLPQPQQKGRADQSQEHPPPPPKRRPPAGMGEPPQMKEAPAAVLKERAPPPPPPLSEMPAAMRERDAAKLTARSKTILAPRAVAKVLPSVVATLVAAGDSNTKKTEAASGSGPPPPPPGYPSSGRPDQDAGKRKGKGGGRGDPAVPNDDVPGEPDPNPKTDIIESVYKNLTMSEAGKLIESNAGMKKMKAKEIEQLRWGPGDMAKGWGREHQKCIIKYVENPYKQKYQPDNAALVMRTREDGMGDNSVQTSEWMSTLTSRSLS